jgi:NADH dehydrogenase
MCSETRHRSWPGPSGAGYAENPAVKYRYRDNGSLVTLGDYSTVGSLMGALTGSVIVSGCIARLVYLSLHKMHQLALHGWLRTGLITLANPLGRSVNPQIKLH